MGSGARRRGETSSGAVSRTPALAVPPATASYVNQASGEVKETVAYSEVRYTGNDLLVVDSTPAGYRRGTSKLLVRGLNEDGQELDNFTLARTSRFF